MFGYLKSLLIETGLLIEKGESTASKILFFITHLTFEAKFGSSSYKNQNQINVLTTSEFHFLKIREAKLHRRLTVLITNFLSGFVPIPNFD